MLYCGPVHVSLCCVQESRVDSDRDRCMQPNSTSDMSTDLGQSCLEQVDRAVISASYESIGT